MLIGGTFAASTLLGFQMFQVQQRIAVLTKSRAKLGGVARIRPIAGAGQEGRATSCLRWRVSRAALGGIDISASTSPRSLRPLTLAGPGGGFSLEPVHAVGPEFCLSAMKGVKCCEFTLEVAAGQNSGFGSDRSSRYASGGRSKQVGDSSRYGTRSTQTAQ
jgi:hypothetical protein